MTKKSIDDHIEKADTLGGLVEKEKKPKKKTKIIRGSGDDIDSYSPDYKNRNAKTTTLGENR